MSTLEVRLFDSDALTSLGLIGKRRAPSFREDFNGIGGGSVAVPAASVGDIDYGQVVKGALDGEVVSAFIVQKKSRVHVAADGTRWCTVSGPGLTDRLRGARVWPQGGIDYNHSPADRPFNFAGVGGHWYDLVTWSAPLGFKQSATSSGDYRYKSPKAWPDPNAYWIWPTNPAATVAANAKAYMRSTFALEAPRKMKFFATADNNFQLYLDGALILSTSDVQAEGANYTGFAQTVVQVPAGPHILAAYVTNGASGSPGDRAGFLFTSTLLNPNGTPSTVLRHSDLTNWFVTDTEPKWYPAEILSVILGENRGWMLDQGVSGPLQNLRLGWTGDEDSNGDPWTTARALPFRVGTSALDVVNALVDHSIDFWMDPDTFTLNAYETRGTDRSQAILLSPVKNLDAFETDGQGPDATAALVRSALGWTFAMDADGVADRGYFETFLEYGNIRSESVAAAQAARFLARKSRVTVATPQVDLTITADARPLIDYFPGDRVTCPSSTGGQTTGRVLSLSVYEDDNGNVKASADLEVAA